MGLWIGIEGRRLKKFIAESTGYEKRHEATLLALSLARARVLVVNAIDDELSIF